MTGLKFDLKSIGQRCRQFGAKFLVDGTQSVGALPLNLQETQIDVLVCASYKWMLGPYGLGLAYYGDDFDQGIPLEESWANRTNAKNFGGLTKYDSNYSGQAGRYNVGESANFISAPVLLAALEQLNVWTPEGLSLIHI